MQRIKVLILKSILSFTSTCKINILVTAKFFLKQLKDQNCPESFDLLAHVVCQLNWTDIVIHYSQCYGRQGTSQVLACVLLLLVQCYGDQKHVEVP